MNDEEYIESRNVDAVRKALINTEKGLKDAVTMLRSDMVDIVARITNIEHRLNEFISPCLQCKCLQSQQVMLLRFTNNLSNMNCILHLGISSKDRNVAPSYCYIVGYQ